ncbi:MAG: hypothetical protein PHW83_03695 [Bacteroidales bacterium]|nr:hypothetical protein [Bacteroidales bacterium]
MRKLLFIFVSVLLAASVYAQSPEKISYQAVIRDNSNQLIAEQTIGMQISILQGSISGTAVYVETQTPTTNANGLVSIEIGTGTVQIGNFTLIDWGNGPFFIKTETDLEGETNYTIIGISQLLSVPYALHAKTAETIVGAIEEIDPVFEVSVASGITEEDTIRWNNKLDYYLETQSLQSVIAYGNNAYGQIKNLDNPTDLQDAVTKAYVDSNDIIDGSCEGEMLYWNGNEWTKIGQGGTGQVLTFCNNMPVWTTNGICPPAIGDTYLGGVIAYIYQCGDPGYVQGEIHGIIAAPYDQATNIEWGCYATPMGTTDLSLGAGATNTEGIVNGCSSNNIAAKICYDLSLNGYDDWVLPSYYELLALHTNRNIIGGFDEEYGYWSSTEFNSYGAYAQMFSSGSSPVSFNKSNSLYKKIRAIRYF